MVIEGLEKPKDDIHEHDHGVEEEEAEGEIAEVACTCASERGEACPRHQVSCN